MSSDVPVEGIQSAYLSALASDTLEDCGELCASLARISSCFAVFCSLFS